MSWLSRIRHAFRPDEVDREIDDELQFHADQRGLPRLPRHLKLKEESREVRIAIWLESVLQDLRLAVRVWRRRPLLAFTAIATLAVGAGMNVAVFRIVWNVMLKPLPYAAPSELAQVWMDDGKQDRQAPPNVLTEKWRAATTIATAAQFRMWRFSVTGGGDPEQVFAGVVSPEFFATLGVRLIAGRTFQPDEYAQGNAAIARESILRRRGLALGGEVVVDGVLCRIVGVIPDAFLATPLIEAARSGGEPELYLPLVRAKVGGATHPMGSSHVIVRLRRGAPIPVAEQELQAIARTADKRRVWLSPLDREIGRSVRPALLALIAATACILLIACANLANLLLAQAVGRRREIAMRTALGASRLRVARQLMAEALLLSVAGGVAGVLAAQWMSSALIALYPDAIPRLNASASDWPIYAFAFALTTLSGLLFGILPAWRESRADLRVGSALMSRGTRRWAGGMVVAQVALTTVVLASAGLLLKSFLNLRDVNTGFAPAQLVTTSVQLPPARYKTKDDRARFARAWVERLQAIPGVRSAGISNSMPIRYTGLLTLRFPIPGFAEEQEIGGRAVSSGFFAAMGVTWAAGRAFEESRPEQVVVNEAFAKRYLNGVEPVGFVLKGARNAVISGVIRNVRQFGLRQAATPEIYLPFALYPLDPVDTAIRTSLPEAQLHGAMRRELKALDSDLVLGKVMTMDAVIDGELARPRFHTWLLALFASVAVLLAAVGIFGVIAHHVRTRVPEFGVRRALGASTGQLFWLVMRDGLRAPALGLVVGVAVGWFVIGRLWETMLFGVTGRDLSVYAATVAVLAATAMLACVVPGVFASCVSPAVALRAE